MSGTVPPISAPTHGNLHRPDLDSIHSARFMPRASMHLSTPAHFLVLCERLLSTSESEDSASLGLPRDGGYNLLALDPTSLALPCLISDCPFRLGGWGPSGSSQVGRVTTVAIKIRAFLGKRKAPFGRRKTTNCPLKVASACRSRPLRSPVSVVGSASCKSLSVDRKDPPLHRPSSQPGHQDAKCL